METGGKVFALTFRDCPGAETRAKKKSENSFRDYVCKPSKFSLGAARPGQFLG